MKEGRRRDAGRRAGAILLVIASALPILPGRAAATCAETEHPGGEWRSYGGDLANTRHQPAEETIGSANAGSLRQRWQFKSTYQGGSGVLHSTPVIADGCLYVGTSTGYVYALHADSGALAWQRQLPVGSSGLLGTGVVGSTPVADGKVFVNVSQAGAPYTAALDSRTGALLWQAQLDATPGSYNDASPVPFDGLVFAGFVGDESGPNNRGGYAILDAGSGTILAKHYTIPDEDFEKGFKGGGIWSTAAVDTTTKYAYVGTANPTAGRYAHPHTNAILKIDLDRARTTFGEIVGAYAGTPERYVENDGVPGCLIEDETVNVFARSAACLEGDYDFGASPQLFQGPTGTYVGEFQKSGVYHVARADTMARVWTSVVAPPLFYANISTATTDGTDVYVAGSLPGHVVRLDGAQGAYRWLAPMGDPLHFNATSWANGVVYATDSAGFLHAFDAATGMPLVRWPIGQDVGDPNISGLTSAGIAIARNTVYVAVGGYVVAYGL